jgi:PHD/YefM family antitoxin component YafN of YafNO toxin-antitoxin module
MPAQTLKRMGKNFVLLPKSEYDRMQAKLRQQTRQDRGDVAESRRRAKERSVPLSDVRKRLRL